MLIIQRVANKSALTNKSLVSGHLSSFKARSQGELTGRSGVISDRDPASSVDGDETNTGELGVGVGVETTNDSDREEVY